MPSYKNLPEGGIRVISIPPDNNSSGVYQSATYAVLSFRQFEFWRYAEEGQLQAEMMLSNMLASADSVLAAENQAKSLLDLYQGAKTEEAFFNAIHAEQRAKQAREDFMSQFDDEESLEVIDYSPQFVPFI